MKKTIVLLICSNEPNRLTQSKYNRKWKNFFLSTINFAANTIRDNIGMREKCKTKSNPRHVSTKVATQKSFSLLFNFFLLLSETCNKVCPVQYFYLNYHLVSALIPIHSFLFNIDSMCPIIVESMSHKVVYISCCLLFMVLVKSFYLTFLIFQFSLVSSGLEKGIRLFG